MPEKIKDAFGNPLKGPFGISLELRLHTPEIKQETEHPLKDIYNALKKAKEYVVYLINSGLLNYIPIK